MRLVRNISTRKTSPGYAGGVFVSHDIDDLLAIIKELEERIIKLESKHQQRLVQHEDAWYWEHG